MTRILNTIIAVALFAAMAACGSTTVSESDLQADLDGIEKVVGDGEWERAQSMYDRMSDKFDQMSPRQLVQASIIGMRLSDHLNASDNVATATQLYLKAFASQPDSAVKYYQMLPPEYNQYISVMRSLSHAITNPPQLTGDTLVESGEEVDYDFDHDDHEGHDHD